MLTRLAKRTRGAGLFALAFFFVGLSAYAEKTDVVNLRNGDRMTGEVKGMNQGRLTFKTDTMDTVSIKWTEVVRIVTRYACEIELEDRSTYFGSLATSLRDGHLKLITEAGTMDFEIAAIVRITPIKSSFTERWDGYATVGFSFTNASDVATTNFSAWMAYSSRKNYFKASAKAFVTDQTDIQVTRRWSNDLEYERYFDSRWYGLATTRLEENTQLGVELRSTTGLGIGRTLIRTNSSRFTASLGVALNAEDASGSAPSDTTAEGVASINYALFRYNVPKRDVTVGMVVYPALDGSNRIRSSFSANVRYEVVTDFFWDLQLYTDYDSAPPNADAARSDLYIVTGVGYSF